MKPFVITSILAPTDLSDSSLPALRYARFFADRFAARLTVLYVEPIAGPSPGWKELEQHASPVMEGRPFDIDVVSGQPVPAILTAAAAHHADLIVTGTHLRHGWRRALLGSVSEGVLHGSACPVLTVGARDRAAGTAPHAIADILCPINFTEVARESLHAAARLAQAFDARLTVIHVVESDEFSNAAWHEETVRRWVAPELQDVCAYRELVVRGGAAERVLDCAEDLGCDFLVIGAQQRPFRDETVIGTTSERLIRFASCPVMVVPRQAVTVAAEQNVVVATAEC